MDSNIKESVNQSLRSDPAEKFLPLRTLYSVTGRW
jgi:hypothetical protein